MVCCFRRLLDWDLKSPQSYADAPMVEMAELVVDLYSKTQSVSSKLTGEMPQLSDHGPFTYDKTRFDNSEEGHTTQLSPLQGRLITCLRGMQSLDRGLRNMKFGQSVNIPDKHRRDGKYVAADQLRDEVTKWFTKCQKLEQELQANKVRASA